MLLVDVGNDHYLNAEEIVWIRPAFKPGIDVRNHPAPVGVLINCTDGIQYEAPITPASLVARIEAAQKEARSLAWRTTGN